MARRFYLTVIAIALALSGLVAITLMAVTSISAPAATAIGLASVLGAHALALGIEFVVIRRLNNACPLPENAPVSGRPGLFLAWLVEVPSAWHTFLWLIPFFGHRSLPSGSDPNRIPVVLVHGFTCNRAVWWPMARWLADLGYPIAAPNLEPLHGDIDNFAEQVHTTVTALQARTGASQVVLLGHSMGGIAIRSYIRRYGTSAIRHAITIGSPHHGTVLAQLVKSRLASQLRLQSPWLRDLAASESDATGQLFSLIVGTDDNIVTPAAIQILPGSRVTYFAGMGHVDLLRRIVIWETVLDILEQHDPAPSAVLPTR